MIMRFIYIFVYIWVGWGSSVGRVRYSWSGGFCSGRRLFTGWVVVSIMRLAETKVVVSPLCLRVAARVDVRHPSRVMVLLISLLITAAYSLCCLFFRQAVWWIFNDLILIYLFSSFKTVFLAWFIFLTISYPFKHIDFYPSFIKR